MNQKMIDVGSTKVFVVDSGSGLPILFLHGWGGTSETWQPVFERLKLKLRLVALDFPGSGRSPLPSTSWSLDDFSECVIRLADELGFDRFAVAGRSFGGRVAIDLAARYPERIESLVLIASAGIPPKRGVRYWLTVWVAKTGKWILRVPLLNRLADVLGSLFISIFGSDDYASSGARGEVMKRVVAVDQTGQLSSIQCPTLLIWGANDDQTPLSDGRRMSELIHDAELHVIQKAGHQVHTDRPDDAAELMTVFFNKHTSR